MNILGINGGVRLGNWDAACAIVRDGNIIAAAEEERFSRSKHAPGSLPTYAIRACLKKAGLTIRDIDCVVFPGRTYVNMRDRLRNYFDFVFGHSPRVELVDHHLAHAACAYRTSGFDEALVITWDYSGDGLSTTVRAGRGPEMKLLAEIPFPQSLGLFYALVTQHLGFDFGEDEYKVMGLSSYGREDQDLSWLLKGVPGGYELRADLIRKSGEGEPPLSPQEALFNDVLLEKLGPPRRKESGFESRHENFAASAQAQLERIVVEIARHYQKETGIRKLCMAGGVAMNCVANQRLAAMPEFEEVYVPPVAGDNGLALGAALEQAYLEGDPPSAPMMHAALGPEYRDGDIASICDELGISFQLTDDPAATAAELIARGMIIGWFQGRMEYGARALGHRSILADPRVEDMKNRVNAVVKFREGFRPFAPSVLEERASEFFESDFHAPFMTFTFNVKPGVGSLIPAVTHVDNTARVQTVREQDEPLYHSLIRSVSERTGIPVVLNTSFNIKGQPIVENPYQAISTFFGSGLEALVIGSCVVVKPSK